MLNIYVRIKDMESSIILRMKIQNKFIKYSLIIISQAIGGVNYNVYRLRGNRKHVKNIHIWDESFLW